MFDKDSRAVIINKRYIEMFKLSPDRAKPGCTLRDLLRQRLEAGTFEGDIEQFISLIASGQLAEKNLKLPDGRTIRVTDRPLPDGGGSQLSTTSRNRSALRKRATATNVSSTS
jgi:hypothetical protein